MLKFIKKNTQSQEIVRIECYSPKTNDEKEVKLEAVEKKLNLICHYVYRSQQ